MEKLIACCGLDCNKCDARKATLTNDDELRAKTAEIWSTQFKAQGITPEMINCNGCREEGPRFDHCNACEIRNCATSNGFSTCAGCDKLENCSILGNILQYVPDALINLKSII